MFVVGAVVGYLVRKLWWIGAGFVLFLVLGIIAGYWSPEAVKGLFETILGTAYEYAAQIPMYYLAAFGAGFIVGLLARR